MTFNFDELNTIYSILGRTIEDNVIHAANMREEWETTENPADKAFWRESIDGTMAENMELNELRKKVMEMMKNTRIL